MSGIGIIIPNADFSKKNFGTVGILSNIEVKKISILGDSVIQGERYTFEVLFYPAFTNQRELRWAIVNGGDYASIDQSTGELIINESASASSVKIRAESLYNPEIFDEKSLTVTYEDLEDKLYGMKIMGDIEASGNAQYEIKYEPSNSSYRGVKWSISDGLDCASIDQSGKLTVKKEGYVKIKATNEKKSNVYTTKIVHVEPQSSDLVYVLPKPFMGDGKSYIDTGFKPYESEEQEWTVIAHIGGYNKRDYTCFFSSASDQSPWNGLELNCNSLSKIILKLSRTEITLFDKRQSSEIAIGFSKDSNNNYNIIYSVDGVNIVTVEENNLHDEFTQSNLNLLIGSMWMDKYGSTTKYPLKDGYRVNSLKIYNKSMDIGSLKDKIMKITNAPEIKSLSYNLPQTFIGNAADAYVNTGVSLMMQNMAFTIIGKMKVPGDFLFSENVSNSVPLYVINAMQELIPFMGITVGINNTRENFLYSQAGNGNELGKGNKQIRDITVWFSLNKTTENKYSLYAVYDGGDIITINENIPLSNILLDLPILIGASYKGAVENDGLWHFNNSEVYFLQIYSYALSKSEFKNIIKENQ